MQLVKRRIPLNKGKPIFNSKEKCEEAQRAMHAQANKSISNILNYLNFNGCDDR